MIGVLAGILLALPIYMMSDLSWWLIVAGGVLGLVFELALRMGAGEEFGSAVGSAIMFGADLSSAGGGGGGDSGGSSGGFDCGGGGGDSGGSCGGD